MASSKSLSPGAIEVPERGGAGGGAGGGAAAGELGVALQPATVTFILPGAGQGQGKGQGDEGQSEAEDHDQATYEGKMDGAAAAAGGGKRATKAAEEDKYSAEFMLGQTVEVLMAHVATNYDVPMEEQALYLAKSGKGAEGELEFLLPPLSLVDVSFSAKEINTVVVKRINSKK